MNTTVESLTVETILLTVAGPMTCAAVWTAGYTLSAMCAPMEGAFVGLWIERNEEGVRLTESKFTGTREEVASILAKRMASYGITF